MLFRRSDVPLDGDASGRFLPWLVAVMVYLAALALICALSMSRAIGHWEQGLRGTLTIQVPRPAQDDELGDNAAATPDTAPGTAPDALDRVVQVLIATPGVSEAKVLEPEEIKQLLEPWLGAAAGLVELPVPALISVTLDDAAEPDLERLRREIASAAPDAVVDTHQAWLDKVRDLARSVQWVAVLVVGLIGGCAVAIVAFATRMGLSVHGPVIQLLHMIGARDSYVASQFQAHALTFALRGGIVGLLFAVGTVYLIGRTLRGGEAILLPELALRPLDWTALALLPLLIALVAMVTARVTVLRTLGRMP
jgi:cell division transport system permease protein